MERFEIPLDNGGKLVVEKNQGSEFDKEIYVGIENASGAYVQDLVIVRPTYTIDNEIVKFNSEPFEVLVYADADNEDYTNKFIVPLHKEEE